MQFLLVAALLIAVTAVVFALQNTAVVTIYFLGWIVQGSLALVLLITFGFGLITNALASLPSRIKKNKTIAQQKRLIQELEASLKVDAPFLSPSEPVN